MSADWLPERCPLCHAALHRSDFSPPRNTELIELSRAILLLVAVGAATYVLLSWSAGPPAFYMGCLAVGCMGLSLSESGPLSIGGLLGNLLFVCAVIAAISLLLGPIWLLLLIYLSIFVLPAVIVAVFVYLLVRLLLHDF